MLDGPCRRAHWRTPTRAVAPQQGWLLAGGAAPCRGTAQSSGQTPRASVGMVGAGRV